MTAPLTREELCNAVKEYGKRKVHIQGTTGTVRMVPGESDVDAIMQLIDTYTQQQWEAQEAIRKDQLARAEKVCKARVLEIEKAYGGCQSCFGKGYATVKSQIIGYGTDGDIGGYEGKYKRDNPVQMNYCDCERGKQLEALNSAAITNARVQELGAVVAGLQEGYVPSIISIQQMKYRLAALQKQLEDDKN